MEWNLPEVPEHALQLSHDYQRENNQRGADDGYLPVKTIKKEYMPISIHSNGQDDKAKMCYINGQDIISRDTLKLENSGKLTNTEEKIYEKENIVYYSNQQPQLSSQINITNSGKYEIKPPTSYSLVCDHKVKAELEHEQVSYACQMNEAKLQIDDKICDFRHSSADQDKRNYSSVKSDLKANLDEYAETYEASPLGPIPETLKGKLVKDFDHRMKLLDVDPDNVTDERPIVHKKGLTKVMLKCFVSLKRLSPGYIKENTRSRSGAPNLPDPLPEGLGIIQTDTGVWSTRFLPKGTEFGPYDPSTVSSDSSSDMHDWMSSLRSSSDDNVHNMEVMQLGSKIFYKVVSDIQPHTELILLQLKPNSKIDKTHTDSEELCQEVDTMVTNEQKYSFKKPQQCKQYGKLVCQSGNLEKHMKSPTKSHECTECGKFFSTRSSMKTHTLIHTKRKAFQCIECGKEFTQKPHLASHMFTHSGEKPHECKQCGKFFSQSGHLKQHMTTHTGEKSHKCSECGKLFSDRSSMKRHMLTHTKQKPFQCIECGKEFTRKVALEGHMFTHSGEKPHGCKQCGKFFSLSRTLKQHMICHTVVKSHECSICGKLFSNINNMKRHMLIHTEEKPFQCIECGKEFPHKSNLVKHMITHSGEKPHQCKQCGKFFAHSGNLKKHMTSHTGEKSHKCSVCGMLFSQSSNMKRHMLTHTKEKPFQCIECGKEFTQKQYLATHMFTHSGEKPFQCVECGKEFTVKHTLTAHMLTHKTKPSSV